jgi:hypothetical protein
MQAFVIGVVVVQTLVGVHVSIGMDIGPITGQKMIWEMGNVNITHVPTMTPDPGCNWVYILTATQLVGQEVPVWLILDLETVLVIFEHVPLLVVGIDGKLTPPAVGETFIPMARAIRMAYVFKQMPKLWVIVTITVQPVGMWSWTRSGMTRIALPQLMAASHFIERIKDHTLVVLRCVLGINKHPILDILHVKMAVAIASQTVAIPNLELVITCATVSRNPALVQITVDARATVNVLLELANIPVIQWFPLWLIIIQVVQEA